MQPKREISDSGFDVDLELDGRVVKLALYGDKSLKNVVFYFHGFPGSRLEASIAHPYALKSGLSLVAIDRPGIGGSTFQAERELSDWPLLVEAVADKLNVETFSICAVSGGAPYAIACHKALPNRVNFILIISGLSSIVKNRKLIKSVTWPIRLVFSLGSRCPRLAQLLVLPLVLAGRKWPRLIVRMGRSVLGPADAKLLGDSEVVELLTLNIKESLSQGTRGILRDLLILMKPWTFSQLSSEEYLPEAKVVLIHGKDDDFVPPDMSLQNFLEVSKGEVYFLPGQGHFMIFELGELVTEILLARSVPRANNALISQGMDR